MLTSICDFTHQALNAGLSDPEVKSSTPKQKMGWRYDVYGSRGTFPILSRDPSFQETRYRLVCQKPSNTQGNSRFFVQSNDG